MAACAAALISSYFVPTSVLAFGGAHSGIVRTFAGERATRTCVLMADARIACTTVSSFDESFVPLDVAGKDVTKVAISESFGCALTADSRVFCWGDNSYGRLGTDSSHDEPEPVQLFGADFDNVVDIAVGDHHPCAIRMDGTAWCWGSNVDGQLGNYKLGIGSSTNIPTQVILHDGMDTPLVNLKTISAGDGITCALFTDNSGSCWGYDKEGELANGKMGYSLPGPLWYRYDSPQTIFVLGRSGLERFIMGGGVISIGSSHGCSLVLDTPDKSIGCWGYNLYGQLGTGNTRDQSSAYSAMDERGKITDAISVSSGSYFTCALVVDGTVRCWGYNGNLQIGSPAVAKGDYQENGTPVVDETGTKRLDKVIEIAAGEYGVCARRRLSGSAVDQIVCWGHDFSTGTDRAPSTRFVDAPLFTDNFDGN